LYLLVLPDTTLPLGSHNVAVKVKNFATTTITGFRLRHSVNGSNIQDTVITGISLAQYDTISVYMGSGKQATFGHGSQYL
jgi:D-aminopeptidase